MERIYIKNIIFEQQIKLQGFVDTYRNKGKMAFLVLKDITGKVQITIEKEKHPELITILDQITPNSIVTVIGTAVKSEFVRLNQMEVLPETIILESRAEPSPIDDNSFIDLRLDYRWLDLRSEKNLLMFQVQTTFVAAFREFLLNKNFLEIHTPKIIATASESGSEVFELEYFERKAYLAQSPQFYKQMAMASGFERIFESGPVFRAEKSFSSKHATEFTGFDLEFSYIDSYHDVMKIEEEMLTYGLKRIKEKYGDKIKELYGIEINVPNLPFPRIKLNDLYQELETRYGYTVPKTEKGDMTTEAEKLSHRLALDKYGSDFLFVTDFSAAHRAFYHMRDEQGIPQGFDLIWKGIEITTGAQREHRYDILKKQAEEKGLADDVKFYLEFFKYGCPPHGGLGIGIDRITMILLEMGIKESMFIFRGPNRLNP